MILLVTYVLIALIFSFLCSIAEAVILSVTAGHIAVLEKGNRPSGRLLHKLKDDINSSLAAILTLNTIAHTVGAAGAGAQAASVFGNTYLGIASAILTLLILVFSEIIPKTLGAYYWKALAPVTAYWLKGLIWLLYPFVLLSNKLTGTLAHGPTLTGYSREEFSAMAELSQKEGLLARKESKFLRSLLSLHKANIMDAATPRTVIFSLAEDLTVGEFFSKHATEKFSRIPVYSGEREHITGFVLRADLLLAQANGDSDNRIATYRREILTLPNTINLANALDEFLEKQVHIVLVVDEYGGIEGILTLEDVLETLLGLEIVDEGDRAKDMQQLARRLWRRRAQRMGLNTGNP
ncbi:MAG: HlyC/CorC family transporter [Gammaproteobacteria bacterium]|nr:HlyC/CorC family transporter [Gammaproteobacteria bacterium]